MAPSAESSSLPQTSQPLPLWLNPDYAKHIVKGNFMTLSTKPRTVEDGEWMAHQTVEQYRVLWNFIRIILEREDDGTAICSCSKMSAGLHSYTWLNELLQPEEVSAHEYITRMHRWMSDKIDSEDLFPTDPQTVSFAHNASIAINVLPTGSDDWTGRRSGFPKELAEVCQSMFVQMFRVYAHLYWDHFVEPFYHLNLEKQLNSCFSHFLLTATTLDLLTPRDMEPMQLLVNLWAANGTFPSESKAYSYATLNSGS